MTQVRKFYLASFLKNQTYFVPILVVFFQDVGLDFSQIFWIFTAGSVLSFLLEIPTGLFADFFGKRRSIIISKLVIFLGFVAFGFASGFWTLLLANLLYELGKSFRSGTETAYVFDYLGQAKSAPSYTEVKANQKFYARISESAGTAIGGWLAVQLGFSAVFFLAAVPALVNFLLALTWARIPERDGSSSAREMLSMAGTSLRSVARNGAVRRIVANIMLFAAALAALDKFVQPYMTDVGIPLAYFGLIYSGFLILVAFLVRYASKLEERFGGVRVVNLLTLVSFLPLLALGLGLSSWVGVALFFFVLMVENVRSPIANNVFHGNVQSENRSTMGSILELFKSSGKLALLPVTGYLADFASMQAAILMLAGVVLVNALLFWITRPATRARAQRAA